VRLIVRAERPGTVTLRILDRRPRPPVLLQKDARLVRCIGDVDPEVGELGMLLLKLGIGDRLALTRASPGRPDVDEHPPPAVVDQRDPLAVE